MQGPEPQANSASARNARPKPVCANGVRADAAASTPQRARKSAVSANRAAGSSAGRAHAPRRAALPAGRRRAPRARRRPGCAPRAQARRSGRPEAGSAQAPVGSTAVPSAGANRRPSSDCSSPLRPGAPSGRAAGVVDAHDVGTLGKRIQQMAEGAAGLVESQRYETGDAGSDAGERLRRLGELRRARPRAASRRSARAPPRRPAGRRLRLASARRDRVCEPGQRLAREARHEVDRPRRRLQCLQAGRREPPSGLGGARIRQCAARRRADGAPHEQRALRPRTRGGARPRRASSDPRSTRRTSPPARQARRRRPRARGAPARRRAARARASRAPAPPSARSRAQATAAPRAAAAFSAVMVR